MKETEVIFKLSEVNDILNRLSEIPAKYSFDLIGFIRGRAQDKVNADIAATQAEVAPEKLPDQE